MSKKMNKKDKEILRIMTQIGAYFGILVSGVSEKDDDMYKMTMGMVSAMMGRLASLVIPHVTEDAIKNEFEETKKGVVLAEKMTNDFFNQVKN